VFGILRAVIGWLRRAASLATVLALIAGDVALCAGWAATPEARMACCTDGDCPMHKHESHDAGSDRVVTQAQADSCCASSERQRSDPSAPTFISVISSAVLGAGVVLPAPVPALVARDSWRTFVPIPIAPVPRHVLLSVFLV
jgi:hypothetical protein